MTRTIYVLSTSRASAERHAALEADLWFRTEAEARAWLDRWPDRDMAALFAVYRATSTATHDGEIWTAHEPVTMAGALMRAACVVAGFAGLVASGGWLTIAGA